MWRFILVTFAFLGWSFYELSGGADYRPHDNSIQARAKAGDLRPVEVDVAKIETVTGASDATDTPSVSIVGLSEAATDKADRVQVTLASVSTTAATETAAKTDILTRTDPASVDQAVAKALTEGASAVQPDEDDAAPTAAWPGAIELFAMKEQQATLRAQAEAAARAAMDIRYVTGNVVNMRGGPGTEFGKVAKLTEGTEVAVLEDSGDGWIMLRVMDTGEEGWMADWLVSASNY